MSFEVQPAGRRARVFISIEYSLPMGRSGAVREWLARGYARWCVARMAADVAEAFQ